jgi:hypothetical protein
MPKHSGIWIEPTAQLRLPSGKTIYTRTWVKDIQKLLMERTGTAVHRLAVDITRQLQSSNPKSTELSSYSWFSSIGAAPTGVAGLDDGSKEAVTAFRRAIKTGDARVSKRDIGRYNSQVKKDWEKGRKRKSLNIVNNVYYVDSLDSRTPFVEDAVNAGIAIASKSLKL